MDKRINYKLVIDTETCPIDKTLEKVDPYNMFVYDIGFQVVDKRGNVYEKYSFINKDIFFNEKDLMKSAYYAEKIPNYLKDIEENKRVVADFYSIRKVICDLIETYNIKEVYAHNMRFDYGTLNNTERWLTKSKYRYFFPYGMEICDTLKMSRDILKEMPSYKKFCIENDFMTKNNQPKYSAEVIYRFISDNVDFIENHTALEDVEIETEILAWCYKQHKKMRRLLW